MGTDSKIEWTDRVHAAVAIYGNVYGVGISLCGSGSRLTLKVANITCDDCLALMVERVEEELADG